MGDGVSPVSTDAALNSAIVSGAIQTAASSLRLGSLLERRVHRFEALSRCVEHTCAHDKPDENSGKPLAVNETRHSVALRLQDKIVLAVEETGHEE